MACCPYCCPYCGAAKGEYCGSAPAKVYHGTPCPWVPALKKEG